MAKFLLIASTLSLAATAHAEPLVCRSKVTQVALTPSGQLYAELANIGTPYLCNVSTAVPVSGGINMSTEACRSLQSLLMTAQASGTQIQINLSYDNAVKPANCNGLPQFSWQIPSLYPYWIAILSNQ